jgi:hypothetical protein
MYFSPDSIRMIKSRRMRGGAFSAHGGNEKCVSLQHFYWTSYRRRLKNNIKMGLKKIGLDVVE